jgi:hypothetical protein
MKFKVETDCIVTCEVEIEVVVDDEHGGLEIVDYLVLDRIEPREIVDWGDVDKQLNELMSKGSVTRASEDEPLEPIRPGQPSRHEQYFQMAPFDYEQRQEYVVRIARAMFGLDELKHCPPQIQENLFPWTMGSIVTFWCRGPQTSMSLSMRDDFLCSMLKKVVRISGFTLVEDPKVVDDCIMVVVDLAHWNGNGKAHGYRVG